MHSSIRKVLPVLMAAVAMTAASWAAAQETQPGQKWAPAAEPSKEAPKAEAPSATTATTQGAGQDSKGGGAKPGGSLFGDQWFLFAMLGGIILLYVWMGRGRRKQEAKRQQMLAGLKKGDKVTSIGGVIGTVIEVREDEVLVKVDETNNVRMRFARWAIRGVGETAKTEKPEDNK